jgi:hypothetical protein
MRLAATQVKEAAGRGEAGWRLFAALARVVGAGETLQPAGEAAV